MKTLLVFCFISFFSCIEGHAQPTFWEPVNSPPSGVWNVFRLSNGRLYTYTDNTWFTKFEGDAGWVPTNLLSGFSGDITFGEAPDGTAYIMGMYKTLQSWDGGATWEPVFPHGNPTQEKVFLLLANGILVSEYYNSLSRSFNRGGSWEALSVPFANWSFIGFGIHDEWRLQANSKTYSSTDSGLTWHETDPMPDGPFVRISPTTVATLRQGPGIEDPQPYYLYVTTDNGGNWVRRDTIPQSGWAATLRPHIALCGETILFSEYYMDCYTDALFLHYIDTTTWKVSTTHPPRKDVREFFVSPQGVLYMATSKGVVISNDCGATETVHTNSGMYLPTLSEIGWMPNHGVSVRSNACGMDWTASSDEGASWNSLGVFLKHDKVDGLISSWTVNKTSGDVYVNSIDSVIKISADLQSSTVVRPNWLVNAWGWGPDGRLYMWGNRTPGIPTVRFFSYTTDEGATWMDMPESEHPNKSFSIDKFLVTNTGFFVSPKGIYNPATAAWSAFQFPVQLSFKHRIADCVEGDNDRIFVSVEDDTLNKRAFVFYSDDDGATWQTALQIAGPWARCRARLIAENHQLFFLTYEGIIRKSDDNGSSWVELNSEFGGVGAFTSFTMDPKGYIWGATESQGLFRTERSLPVESTQALSHASSLSIYPNPAVNTGTVTASITLSQSASGPLTLEVINELGTTVHCQTVERGRQQWSVSLPVTGLPNGYYQVRTIGNGQAMQKGMVIWRR